MRHPAPGVGVLDRGLQLEPLPLRRVALVGDPLAALHGHEAHLPIRGRLLLFGLRLVLARDVRRVEVAAADVFARLLVEIAVSPLALAVAHVRVVSLRLRVKGAELLLRRRLEPLLLQRGRRADLGHVAVAGGAGLRRLAPLPDHAPRLFARLVTRRLLRLVELVSPVAEPPVLQVVPRRLDGLRREAAGVPHRRHRVAVGEPLTRRHAPLVLRLTLELELVGADVVLVRRDRDPALRVVELLAGLRLFLALLRKALQVVEFLLGLCPCHSLFPLLGVARNLPLGELWHKEWSDG